MMKTPVVSLVLLLSPLALHARAQETDRWGESGPYTKWYGYSYDIDSDYEYVDSLPAIDDFPKLLELARRPDAKPNVIDDREIAVSQIRTISRCKFDKLLYADSDVEAEHRAAIVKWEDWWHYYGKDYAGRYLRDGKRYPKAWGLLPGTQNSQCPDYPLLLPDSWSTTMKFRSGDYGGVTEEVLCFSVSKRESSLTRKYRHGWPGQSEWTHEEWRDFTHDEAQLFLAMIIYSVDNPWLYINEPFVSDKKGELRIGTIRGRPKEWSNYYPNVKWTGILDANENVIVNDDVWSWHTKDHERFGKTMFDDTLGVAFRIVLRAFPDPSFRPTESRWNAITRTESGEPCVPERV